MWRDSENAGDFVYLELSCFKELRLFRRDTYTTPDHFLLSTTALGKGPSTGILDLLKDCTPTEFVILYENMAELKELLRTHLK